MDALTTKLGTARRVERSRIWIEGKRLTAAGFAVGRYFIAEWQGEALTLTLLDEDTIIADAPRCTSANTPKVTASSIGTPRWVLTWAEIRMM